MHYSPDRSWFWAEGLNPTMSEQTQCYLIAIVTCPLTLCKLLIFKNNLIRVPLWKKFCTLLKWGVGEPKKCFIGKSPIWFQFSFCFSRSKWGGGKLVWPPFWLGMALGNASCSDERSGSWCWTVFFDVFLQLFSYKPTAGARSKLPKKLLVWYEYMYETDEEELRKPEIIFPV